MTGTVLTPCPGSRLVRRCRVPGRRSAGRRLGRDSRGVAALELAVIAPVLFALLFGTWEVTQRLAAGLRTADAAEAMARLVAGQAAGVTPALMTDACAGAQDMLAPDAPSPLALAIASVSNIGGTVARDWEYDAACATAAAPIGAAGAVALATAYVRNKVASAGDSVVLVRATYAYVPAVTYLLGGAVLTHTAFARPRSNTTVPCAGC